MNWIPIVGYATLIFSMAYIILCCYQMFRLRILSKRIRIRGLEYYQLIVPFKPKNVILGKYPTENPEQKQEFQKILNLRRLNGILFFLAFISWLSSVLLIFFL